MKEKSTAELDELKSSMNEWIIFLDGSLRETKQSVIELRRKVNDLQSELDSMSGRS